MSVETIEIACPSCGTVSHFQDLGREASAFCRQCDYPLFWARPPRSAGAEDPDVDGGLRRLPGTAGLVSLATADCPECTEPNPLSATVCIRCGSDLRPPPPTVVLPPAPPPVPVAEPEPVPEPAPARPWWPWAVLAVLAIGAVVALVLLLG
jgi:hypothetical protein